MKPGLPFWLMLLAYLALLAGCGSAPERSFADADLLIDESDLPDGWALTQSGVIKAIYTDEGEKSGAAVSFYATHTTYFTRMTEYVHRYSSARDAAWHYNRREQERFNDKSFYRTTPWQTPPGFTFTSALANQWRFACAGSSFNLQLDSRTHSTICRFQARYEEFLVTFSVDMEIDGQTLITVSELEQVIEAIDRKMVEHLGSPAEP